MSMTSGKDPSSKGQGGFSIRLWAAAAIGLRLVLMPVTMHSDLLFIHGFPYFFSGRGVWDIYGFLATRSLDGAFTYYPPLVYYLIGVFQWCVKLADPSFGAWMARVSALLLSGHAVAFSDYLASLTPATLLRFVFMMKLPYLLADVGCLCLLLGSRIRGADAERMAHLWLFSAVLVFSTYIFGQYRILSAFFMWLAIYLGSRGRSYLSAAAFGAVCLLENYAWFLLVPFICSMEGRWARRLGLVAVFWAVVGPVWALLFVSSGPRFLLSYASPVILRAAGAAVLRHLPILWGVGLKGLVAAAYLFVVFRVGWARLGEASDRLKLFINVSACLLLALYAVSTTVIHYFMWILPFFVVVRAEGEPWPRPLSLALVVLLFLFNLDSRALNAGLLEPLAPDRMMALPSFHEWTSRWFDWGRVVVTARVAFSALCLWFSWRIYARRIAPFLQTY